MKLSLKPLHDQVIVITGASSGIGLATARRAANAGARLVLAARSDDALRQLVDEINSNGGEAIHVTADVGRREEVQAIADTALERFGGFDTWVNNAAVSIFGRLDEVSDEDHHRLFQTNFWGMVYGSLVALKTLRTRGGALINLGSVACDLPLPLQGMYSASKHALQGFTNALRLELEEEKSPVSVTLVKPGSIDTPFAQHAKKYTEHEPELPSPVYAPEEVATAILYAARHPKRDIYIGSSARTLSLLARTAPRFADKIGSNLLFSQQLEDAPAGDRTGALHAAGGRAAMRGGYRSRRASVYTRASQHPMFSALCFAAVGAAGYALVANQRARRTSHDGTHRTAPTWQEAAPPAEAAATPPSLGSPPDITPPA